MEINVSIRSSALTPRPFRPDTSAYDRLLSASDNGMPSSTHVAGVSATISYEKWTDASACSLKPSARRPATTTSCKYDCRESITLYTRDAPPNFGDSWPPG